MSRKVILFVFVPVLTLYCFIAVNALQKPIVGGEWWNHSAAESILANGKPLPFGLFHDQKKELLLQHPPLYLYLVALSYKVFGNGDIQARLIGVFIYLLMLPLLYKATERMYPENKAAPVLALLFFGLHPLAIQGSFVIDIDNTVLMLSTTLFFYLFVMSVDLPTTKRLAIVSLGFFAVLCTKLVPIPALLLSILCFYTLKRSILTGIKETVQTAFFGGGAYFIFNTGIYCLLGYKRLWLEQYKYIWVNFFTMAIRDSMISFFSAFAGFVIRFSLWICPFLLLIFAYIAIKQARVFRSKKHVPRDAIAVIFICITIFFSIFTGGLTYSFPKMQSSLLPLMCMVVAGNLSLFSKGGQNIKRVLIILIIAAGFIYFASGDVIYISNYLTKESVVYGNINNLREIVYPIAVYLMTPIVLFPFVYFLFRKKKFIYKLVLILVTSTLASSISLDIAHVNADYATSFDYGDRDRKEVIDYVFSVLKPGYNVFSVSEMIYPLRLEDSNIPLEFTWDNPENFLGYISERKPEIIIYGLVFNTVQQYRNTFQNPEVLNFLKAGYREKVIGNYDVWVVKEPVE